MYGVLQILEAKGAKWPNVDERKMKEPLVQSIELAVVLHFSGYILTPSTLHCCRTLSTMLGF